MHTLVDAISKSVAFGVAGEFRGSRQPSRGNTWRFFCPMDQFQYKVSEDVEKFAGFACGELKCDFLWKSP